ncbi:MAG: serine hydrolase domain-containing protein [Varibaculum sp.]|nr:serine hydrolase domain-containing protein [Varibaculum sp.]
MIDTTGFDFPVSCVVLDAHGYIDHTGDLDEIRPWASVTKIITAICVLQASDAGYFALNDTVATDPTAATSPRVSIADLLAHSSGLAPDSPRILAEPGSRRIYSSYGYNLLGTYFATKVGINIDRWGANYLLPDLDMETTLLDGSPASAARGSTRDMAALAGSLLRAEVLPTALDSALTAPHCPGIPGVLPGYGRQSDNSWGMGCEIRAEKQPHWTAPSATPATFGHYGMSGSFLWVDREADRAAVFTGKQPFSSTHIAAWSKLNEQLLAL